MIYKFNLFFREWKGYESVYNFFKENLIIFALIRFILYLASFGFLFFNHSQLLSALRVIIYIPLTVIEYFIGCIWYEKTYKFSAYSSYVLMILNFTNVILYSLKLLLNF